MKAIISHDVDHISALEHAKDAIIPKFLARNSIELALGSISVKEYGLRIREVFANKWHHIEAVMDFDRRHSVESTFFVGVANGKGLSYPLDLAQCWIKNIAGNNFDVGVHGIAFDNAQDVKREFETFKKISGKNSFGIRMHYLRRNEHTLEYLADAGYLFDSTDSGIKTHYSQGGMVEFPLNIMDSTCLYLGKSFQSASLREITGSAQKLLDEALEKKLSYLTIVSHDRYFGGSFSRATDWYIWLVEYLAKNNIPFISFRDAVKEVSPETTVSREACEHG